MPLLRWAIERCALIIIISTYYAIISLAPLWYAIIIAELHYDTLLWRLTLLCHYYTVYAPLLTLYTAYAIIIIITYYRHYYYYYYYYEIIIIEPLLLLLRHYCRHSACCHYIHIILYITRWHMPLLLRHYWLYAISPLYY